VEIARRHQATPAQVALAWLLRRSRGVPEVDRGRDQHASPDDR
jgi:aryl-alcohol dehydrogenase-like predicted oxidoreductase